MTLDVAYSYCMNLTESEKLEVDKQVRKNRGELFFAILIALPFWFSGVKPKIEHKVESPVAEKLAPLAQSADDYQETFNDNKYKSQERDKEYKVSKKMSSKLSKISTKVRKDKQTSKSLDKLEEQLI